MGRRQGGVGEASRFVFWEEGQSENASPTHRNPLGRGKLAVFFVRRPRGGCGTRFSPIDLDILVVTASPARTAWKNSQLIRQWPDERDAYFGDRTGESLKSKTSCK
jgi:hypothetical protein